jgi:hypothetical protein
MHGTVKLVSVFGVSEKAVGHVNSYGLSGVLTNDLREFLVLKSFYRQSRLIKSG